MYVTYFNLQKRKNNLYLANDYKNIVNTGKQSQPIVNEQAISTIKFYCSKHKDNTYLFENEFGEPLTETKIVSKYMLLLKKKSKRSF